jgi:TRAP-type mannitol/chloroaromatic compound transport system permease small subunit
MPQLLMVSRALDSVLTRIGRSAAWLLLPMMIVIIVDVITRKFGILIIAKDFFLATGMDVAHGIVEKYITSTKMQELEWHLHAALFLLCMGFGYVKNSHVRIEIVREKFDVYTKSWLEVIGIVLFIIPYSYLLFRFGFNYAERSFHLNEVSAALTGLSHRWIIKAFLPLGMALLFLSALAVLFRNLVFLFGSPEESAEARRISPELADQEDEAPEVEGAAKI